MRACSASAIRSRGAVGHTGWRELCAQWTTSMTGMFAHPVFKTVEADGVRTWLRSAPLVYATGLRALHFVQCPVPRADFTRSWRAEFLSWCDFRSKFAKRQLAGNASSNKINSFLSQWRRKPEFVRRNNRLYTFVYVCASGFVADSKARMTKHTLPPVRSVHVVALRASKAALPPMMKSSPHFFRRPSGMPDDH